MNREIPGYYYDPEKNKYFKIEKATTAPTSSNWSSTAVKRRKIQDTAKEAERRRAHLVRNHIKRHASRRDVVSMGRLNQEIGEDYVTEHGRGRLLSGELASAAWARGLGDKGRISFVPAYTGGMFPNLSCFYVSGEDTKTGLGVAYATLDEETLMGSYVPTDDYGRIRFSREVPNPISAGLSFRTEMIRCPQMSSIKYHRPSHKILLTSREPDHSCGLYLFSPPKSVTDSDRPHWLLGETNHYQRISIRHGLRDEWVVHGTTPAPASSDLICVIGTNGGILRVRSNETMSWIAPKHPPRGVHLPQEIFTQDFQEGNHNVLFAGGRKPRLWTTDLRAPAHEWTFTKHASSIAHLRSINPHQILVSGLRSTMAIYDTRFFGRRPNGATPLLEFPEYQNEAHLHIGWDVNPQLKIAAAAQDNGTVRLFSLDSGRRLRNAAVDAIRTETPIKALMFQQMPNEGLPSLFVGEGPTLRKFSFGTAVGGEEE